MASIPELLIISSLRGGQNDTDPPSSLPDDQCQLAQNVEWTASRVGERRLGTSPITLPAFLSAHSKVTWLSKHLPDGDESASELWAFGMTSTTALGSFARKTSTWQAEVTPLGNLTGGNAARTSDDSKMKFNAVSIDGKKFIAYRTGLLTGASWGTGANRLMVWDGTNLRRSGLVNQSSGHSLDVTNTVTGIDPDFGPLTGVRYYRWRDIVHSGSTVLVRAEPSDAAGWILYGPGGVSVERIGSGGTATDDSHSTGYEIEASHDGVNWYNLGIGPIEDVTTAAEGYAAAGFTLSEDVGDYTPFPNVRYLLADDDRLVGAGTFRNAGNSRVIWSPVRTANGVGNSERYELDTDPFLDLDSNEGGVVTGLAQPGGTGTIYVFKHRRIYKLTRMNRRDKAYTADIITSKFGALHDSVVEGLDSSGRDCAYFLDPIVGPCRLGIDGVQKCSADITTTWKTVNVDADITVCSRYFNPNTLQVIWHVATDTSDTPDAAIVLHTKETIETATGIRGGWAYWTGDRVKALDAIMYAENIEDNTTRSLKLKPLLAYVGNGLIHQGDVGSDDNGTAYVARIITKDYLLGRLLSRFGITASFLMGKVTSGAQLVIKAIRDFGKGGSSEAYTSPTVSMTSVDSEEYAIRSLDDFKMQECQAVRFEFTDTTPAGSGRWELDMWISNVASNEKSYR
jgi:hypothetical protein